MHKALPIAALAVAGVASVVPLSTAHAADPMPPVVFTTDRDGDVEIHVRAADGSTRQLTRNTAHDYAPAWSPDGRHLAFVSTRDGDPEIYVMKADGTGVRQLTRNSKLRSGQPIADTVPAWSPDGRRIAFTSNRDGGEMKIYRMNANGTGQVRLTRTPASVTDHTPSWSPGGHYIVFNSDRLGYDNVEIFRMRMNGSEVVRLTRNTGIDDNAPEYSPDGRRIVFSSTRKGNQHDLFTMRADGTDVRALSGDPQRDDVFPRWSSDGRKVVFSTFPREGVAEAVWAVNSDGTGRTQLASPASAGDPRPVR